MVVGSPKLAASPAVPVEPSHLVLRRVIGPINESASLRNGKVSQRFSDGEFHLARHWNRHATRGLMIRIKRLGHQIPVRNIKNISAGIDGIGLRRQKYVDVC